MCQYYNFELLGVISFFLFIAMIALLIALKQCDSAKIKAETCTLLLIFSILSFLSLFIMIVIICSCSDTCKRYIIHAISEIGDNLSNVTTCTSNKITIKNVDNNYAELVTKLREMLSQIENPT
jgi:hypothetical protein